MSRALLLLGAVWSAGVSASDGTLRADLVKDRVVYSVSGKEIKSEDLLRHFAAIHKDNGPGTTITFLISEKAPGEILFHLRGAAQKVGIMNIEQFYFSPETNRMVKIEITGPAVALPK